MILVMWICFSEYKNPVSFAEVKGPLVTKEAKVWKPCEHDLKEDSLVGSIAISTITLLFFLCRSKTNRGQTLKTLKPIELQS